MAGVFADGRGGSDLVVDQYHGRHGRRRGVRADAIRRIVPWASARASIPAGSCGCTIRTRRAGTAGPAPGGTKGTWISGSWTTWSPERLRTLTGQKDDAAAWDALFRDFNQTHGNLGDVGYQPGEKIVLKINMNQDSGGTWAANAGMPSPQMIHSVLDQLFHVVGVPGADVTHLRRRPVHRRSDLQQDPRRPGPEFPERDVRVQLDAQRADRRGRTIRPIPSASRIRASPARRPAYPPRAVTEAKYLINMALLPGPPIVRRDALRQEPLRLDLLAVQRRLDACAPAQLRQSRSADGLVQLSRRSHRPSAAGRQDTAVPGRRPLRRPAPERRSHPLQLLRQRLDVEPVRCRRTRIAIDSVGLDFLRNEPLATDCTGPGVDNYLHEGGPGGQSAVAQRSTIPTATASVCKASASTSTGTTPWTRSTRAISARARASSWSRRRLSSRTARSRTRQRGLQYNYIRHAVQEANDGDTIIVAPGIYKETVSFNGKALFIGSENPGDPAVVAATVIQGVRRG